MQIKQFKGNGVVPPTNIFAYIIWSLFGNANDGVIGTKSWNPEQKDTWLIRLRWWMRNPLHNFVFYILGNCHKDVTVYGFPSVDVFNPRDGFCFTIGKTDRMIYPFLSYRGLFKFYIGWRLGTSFGIKLTANHH